MASGGARCGRRPQPARMLKITLEVDVSAFGKEVDDHMARAFQPAVVEALNAAGKVAADTVW